MLFPEIERRQNAVPVKLIERCLLGDEQAEWHEWSIYRSYEPNCVCVMKVNKINLSTARQQAWDLYIIRWKDLDSCESYEINIDKRMILLDSIRKAE